MRNALLNIKYNKYSLKESLKWGVLMCGHLCQFYFILQFSKIIYTQSSLMSFVCLCARFALLNAFSYISLKFGLLSIGNCLETLDKQEVTLFALLYIKKSLLVLIVECISGSLDKWNRSIRLMAVTYQHPGIE